MTGRATPYRVVVHHVLSPPRNDPWEVVRDLGGVQVTLSRHETEAEARAEAEKRGG